MMQEEEITISQIGEDTTEIVEAETVTQIIKESAIVLV